MASKNLIDIAVRLGKELGANTSKFLGTKTNISFLGTGPKDGMLFQKAINPESFLTLGVEKVLPDIESSLGYAVGGKLNDIQVNKLIDNLTTMKETLNPTNVVEMGGGLGALRTRSSVIDRPATEAASDVRLIDDATSGLNKAEAEADAFSKSIGFPQAADTSPLMSKIENRINSVKDQTESASAIMETIPKVDLPGKTGSAREFLFNALKKNNPNQTSFSDIVSAEDLKYITEGGGGVTHDPIVLVQKYFGPRVAELLPSNATSEEIVVFTNKIMNNVVDAKGLKPTDPDFDNLTARIVDELIPQGGGQPFAKGGLAKILEL
tara:strand:+ start:840 stop:1808 length:969 start_codon:yes stop_codon:yes gene_type:complete